MVVSIYIYQLQNFRDNCKGNKIFPRRSQEHYEWGHWLSKDWYTAEDLEASPVAKIYGYENKGMRHMRL